MLNDLYQWILNEKQSLFERGIEIEELEYRTDCILPFVKVILNSSHYIGQICLWENRLMDLEALDSDYFESENKLDFYEHHVIENNTNWNELLSKFFNFIIKV